MVEGCSPAMRCTDVSCFTFLFINYKDSDNEIIRSYLISRMQLNKQLLKNKNWSNVGTPKLLVASIFKTFNVIY